MHRPYAIEYFEDIGIYLEEISKQYGEKNSVREIHLLGYGTENTFGFGKSMYSGQNLHDNYKTDLYAQYMASVATIHLQGCNVAAGDAGHRHLKEIGRIFFSDKKISVK